jgi:hypothetical protein
MATPPEGSDISSREGVRVPDFFIVGHKKSGTTALHQMLRRHRQIFMPELKEPHFLASDRRPRFPPTKGQRLPATLDEYLALFADATPGQRAGEASASYLWSRTAADAIADLQPKARIIAILREPASFIRSQHLQFLRIQFEDQKSLRKAVGLEEDRRRGKHIPRRCPFPQMILYSDHVHYVEQLRRYHARLPSEQVLVLIYDDFRRDNEATVRRVLEFLDVDAAETIEAVDANVTTRIVRSQQLDDMLGSISSGDGSTSRAAKTVVKGLTTRNMRQRAMRMTRQKVVHSEPPPVDQEFTLELQRRFLPEVESASEYLGRDLVALWGYDKLG